MSIDPLFPLPDPGFLLVHHDCVLVWRQSLVQPVVDAEGGFSYPTAASVLLSDAYVAMADQSEVPQGESEMESIAAVILVRHGSPVDHADEVDVAGVSAYLDGHYLVTGVRPNASHVRVLVRRMRDTS